MSEGAFFRPRARADKAVLEGDTDVLDRPTEDCAW